MITPAPTPPTEPAHSPLPWRCETPDPVPLVILDAEGIAIISTEAKRAEQYGNAMIRRGADARLIVQSVNRAPAYAKMREALENLLSLPVAQTELKLLDMGIGTKTANAAWLMAREALAESRE